jgi:ATP-dependent exoDNAse (exonuclease V) beta subunit
LDDYRDDAAARYLAQRVRQALVTDGYGPVIYGWVRRLAPHCNRRELSRLEQLVELAYGYEQTATLRTDDFVAHVENTRVADPTAADVRAMTVHQSKGLQFDIVVLPELDSLLVPQDPAVVVDRPDAAGPAQRVCRHAKSDIQKLLPASFQKMFEDATDRGVTESLCVLYVAVTRAIHALHMIIPPSKRNERSLPGTFAGLLRASLRDTDPVAPETLLFTHGNADWCKTCRPVEAPTPPAGRDLATPQATCAPVRLAEPTGQPSRGWERARPSGLEGGTQIQVEGVLAPSRTPAFVQGQLIHAWFEQIRWLDDGAPDPSLLRNVAEQVLGGDKSSSLNMEEQISRFFHLLERPEVAYLLSRARYQRLDGLGFTAAVRRELAAHVPSAVVQNERGFAFRQDGRLMSGYIDRLVLLEHGGRVVAAEIIDYKTDALDAQNPQQLDEKSMFYTPQLEAYRQAVVSLTGLPTDRIAATLAFVAAGVTRSV